MSVSALPTPKKSPERLLFLLFALLPSDLILFNSFTTKSPRTPDKLTELMFMPVCNTPLSPGVLVEPLPEFPESLVLVLPELLKVLSPTLVERVECSLP